MTILVTGGAGFIGANFILDWLQQCDEPVVNLDLLTYAGHLANLQTLQGDSRHVFVRGDIGDSVLVDGLLQKYTPWAIVHFAAESHVDRSIEEPEAFIQTNIVGSFRLLEAARRYWDRIPAVQQEKFRFLYVSTDEVYGSLDAQEPAFTEGHCYRPNSPYSASKAAADHLARACYQTYGLPVLTTHCSNNYGPYQFPDKLIPLLICRALDGASIPIYGDGKNIRDWLYVSDHCTALRQVLAAASPGTVYNIGGNSEKINLDIAALLCDTLDRLRPRKDRVSYRSQITMVADRPGHDRRYAIDSTKIYNELNWKPEISFVAGMERTVSWYLAHPQWIRQVCR